MCDLSCADLFYFDIKRCLVVRPIPIVVSELFAIFAKGSFEKTSFDVFTSCLLIYSENEKLSVKLYSESKWIGDVNSSTKDLSVYGFSSIFSRISRRIPVLSPFSRVKKYFTPIAIFFRY